MIELVFVIIPGVIILLSGAVVMFVRHAIRASAFTVMMMRNYIVQ